ncbi:MMPL family transporter [Actinospica sp. MGRD01-02]|uniref:MMPL family transporter n=1 Tax=Actinospica acidithermotolerans TaxID=2828514 RepID=A0A941IG38_9ACTN|nr:MMPL family transporter [Actinospica acidithermotolerans]MBR7825704.1 MMPL family transporter [Actinospica acidithermotolerans]
MAALLAFIGRAAFRRRWYVVAMWLGVLVAVGLAAAKAPAAPSDSFTMPGTESQQAATVVGEHFPGGGSGGASAQLVFVDRAGGQVAAGADRAAIEKAVAAAAAGPQVASVADPFATAAVSKSGSTAYATVTYKVAATDLTDAAKTALQNAAAGARSANLTVEIGGNALTPTPAAGGATEGIGIAAAFLVLLLTFGSLAAAGVPLITAIVGVGVSMTSITALGHALGLSETTGTLATMLGLAVGIDYAVFIVSRYREEREQGIEAREAAGLAVGTAGSAVVFAGMTVVIGLAGLFVVGVPMLTKMGLAAAGAVAVGVLVALTLVPAMLGLFPNAVLSRSARKGKTRKTARQGRWGAGWARFVIRGRVPLLLLGVIGLGIIATPIAALHLGSQDNGYLATSTTERRAYDDLAKAFGPGFNGPLTVVVDAESAQSPKTAVAEISSGIASTPGVVSVSAAHYDAAGNVAVFSVIPSTGPSDQKTVDLVNAIRGERADLQAGTGATYMVTGATASDIDSATKVKHALLPYLAVVIGLAIVLLLIVFRSALIPFKAAAGFLLSVLAAIGAVVAVFQWGWLARFIGVHQTGPIMTLMPIFMVGIIFGLAMDYEVFLVSRMREAHTRGADARSAITEGFRSSSRVVTAAALIMTAVFSGFIGADNSLIKMIGFGLAIAVLFDAFIVRMTLVPALLAMLGERAWQLPRPLGRILPRVDIEGQSLDRRRERAIQAAELRAEVVGERPTVPAAPIG